MKTTALSIAVIVIGGSAVAEQHMSMSYCDTAFIPGDKNADGMISAEEETAMRDVLYESLDANADGSITREEFAACMTRAQDGMSGMSPATGDDASFDAADANADGSVDAAELFTASRDAYDDAMANTDDTAGMAALNPYMSMPMTDAGDPDIEAVMGFTPDQYFGQVARSYTGADTDADGTLSREEWVDRAQSHMADAEAINNNFDAVDANADGSIDRGEFDTDMASRMEAAMSNSDRDGFTDETKGIPALYYYREAM